jgi:hypothetical protein
MSHQIASELRWPRLGENRSFWFSQAWWAKFAFGHARCPRWFDGMTESKTTFALKVAHLGNDRKKDRHGCRARRRAASPSTPSVMDVAVRLKPRCAHLVTGPPGHGARSDDEHHEAGTGAELSQG